MTCINSDTADALVEKASLETNPERALMLLDAADAAREGFTAKARGSLPDYERREIDRWADEVVLLDGVRIRPIRSAGG